MKTKTLALVVVAELACIAVLRTLTPQPTGCLWHAAEESVRHRDAQILLVRYHEIELGHAYCVYPRGGVMVGWDYRGAVAVPDGDAEAIARALPPPLPGLTVRSAALFPVN